VAFTANVASQTQQFSDHRKVDGCSTKEAGLYWIMEQRLRNYSKLTIFAAGTHFDEKQATTGLQPLQASLHPIGLPQRTGLSCGCSITSVWVFFPSLPYSVGIGHATRWLETRE
jgi:hypothetical protein